MSNGDNPDGRGGRDHTCRSCRWFDETDKRTKGVRGMGGEPGRNLVPLPEPNPELPAPAPEVNPPWDGVCHFNVTTEQDSTPADGWCSHWELELLAPDREFGE